MGPLKQYLAEKISLQRSLCNIFGLTDTVAYSLTKPDFFRFRVLFQACSLQNEVGDPPFFYISGKSNSSSYSGKILRKKSMLENFRANVLNSCFFSHQRFSHINKANGSFSSSAGSIEL